MRKLKKQTGGVISYNPNLASSDKGFQDWYKNNTPEGKNNIKFSDSLDYDYYSYFRNGAYNNYTGGHFPDTYKRPNHQTFSNESIYSTPDNPGGTWQGEKYIPMKKVKKQVGGVTLPKLGPGPEINPFQSDAGQMAYNPIPTSQDQDMNYRRQFDPIRPNGASYGIMGAYLASTMLLNNKDKKEYEAYKRQHIRDYQIPSLLQDPNKFSSTMYESPIYQRGGTLPIKQAVNQMGGMTMKTPQQQGAGYFAYPNAKSLTFPGSGERTFVPGPFPLMVKDDNGTQIMTNRPIKTKGKVVEMPVFEMGGEVRTQAPTVERKDATIEAERGELIFGAGAPGSIEDQEDRIGVGLYKIGGKPHSQGGTPLKAHPGDFVFSKDTSLAVTEEDSKLLVGKEIKKLKQRVPAELAKRYIDLNKYLNMAQDKELDPITKKTAILNVNNFIDRLSEIAYAQEEQKGFPEGIPEFAQASLNARFDTEGLQNTLNEFRYGGQVKYQTGGITDVPDDIFGNATKVDRAPNGYKYVGRRQGMNFYRDSSGKVVQAPGAIPGGTPGDPWKNKMIELLQSGVSIEDLAKQGHGTIPGLTKLFGNYENPQQTQNYVYTDRPMDTRGYTTPNLDIGPLPVGTPIPGARINFPSFDQIPQPSTDQTDGSYFQSPNTRFNINTAEAVGLLAAGIPSESRYPPAFRNYEIQNAKALIAAGGRPISEQPYLNAIQRSSLGRDDQGTFQASLDAQNQAISQVYNQNIARKDQVNSQLAQLEVQDGIDRITNAEKYDNKLEMLANNKELEKANRRVNLSNITNQMVRDRESKSLFNQMSDYYQITPNGGFGLKPTYKIENGKLVPYQRNIADLIKGAGQTTNSAYLDRLRQVFSMMNEYGIRSGSFVDDVVNQSGNVGKPQ